LRLRIADWSAGILAVAVLALGGLVVVKPALDNWDGLYRSNPFEQATTTKKFSQRADRLTGTTTTKQKASAIERVLGSSGLLLVRLGLVAVTAFVAAAVLQRAILADYRLGPRPAARAYSGVTSPNGSSGPAAEAEPAEESEVPTRTGPTAPELGSASLAPPIAKLIASRREELGISQRELAKRAGISHTVVSRIEQGEQTPSRRTLERLADALRASA
jgi:DNA-binding XRE family transcriptional regulator